MGGRVLKRHGVAEWSPPTDIARKSTGVAQEVGETTLASSVAERLCFLAKDACFFSALLGPTISSRPFLAAVRHLVHCGTDSERGYGLDLERQLKRLDSGV